ncbi:recombinase family protein [Patescibacteria group bacterium]|nr:recombinase family protein [Patescibacteria group bacterium]MBV1758056.1 recombinase family protein [Dethiosulfatibacter sp.]
MGENKRVTFIPAKPQKREKRVGIYCRVSTNSQEQLKSLTTQISAFTRLTSANPKWVLVDIYIDIASSKTGSSRKDFHRMIKDCERRDLDIVITKSISRFGRDTVEVLDALNRLKLLGIRVFFEQEELDTFSTDSDIMISVIESIAQAENESRADNIKWGIKKKVADGSSKLYNRKCYGFVHDDSGALIIEEDQAKNVRTIFDLYLHGSSIIGIVAELEQLGIKSPTGKDKWSKRTIDVMLSNEKYIGNVRVLNNGKHDSYYLAEGNNPAIISDEKFKAVQIEKARRSNVLKTNEGFHRKSKKYSSKK